MPEVYEVQLEVRWIDHDLLGHVNHAVIVALIAEARLRWLTGDPPAQRIRGFALPTVVASLYVDFAKALQFGDTLSISMRVSRVGTKSYTIQYAGSQGAQNSFTASTVLVAVDATSGVPRELSSDERAYLERFLWDSSSAVSSVDASSSR